jgi:hypothetical protein
VCCRRRPAGLRAGAAGAAAWAAAPAADTSSACPPALPAGGQVHPVSGTYVEFAERLPRPECASLPAAQLREAQRRDGFEAGSADKIFTSTNVQRSG